MYIKNPLGAEYADLVLPEHTQIVHMPSSLRVENPQAAIAESLAHPIASESLAEIAGRRFASVKGHTPRAVIVVSDNTRPVPYKGEEGILLPIIEIVKAAGFAEKDIMIIIATGTHRAMTKDEIERMIDPAVLAMACPIVNHDCKNESELVFIGRTERGTEVMIDSRYMAADLKIATGLVESHFMAGASGGRKAICPGLIGEKSTFVFHGPVLMADPRSRDLNIEGNPVHEESLAVATMAGVDFLVNVTLDHDFHITGIFSGDLEKAHLAAVEKVKASVQVKMPRGADIVITHGGFVGINHYQCAKCGVASLGLLRKGGYLLIIADTKDKGNVVGGINYRTTLSLLRLQGADGFVRTISSPDWTFIPEQWQVQQWAKVFRRIPMDHMILYSPKLSKLWWDGLPGIDGADFLNKDEQSKPDRECFTKEISASLAYIAKKEGKRIEDMDITYIADGPYVVPITDQLPTGQEPGFGKSRPS